MPRSFSEHEKERIRSSLITACADSWTRSGYKKTSVDALCQQAGISKGAFYLFFDSKEALFCEVLCSVQQQIYETTSQLLRENPTPEGIKKALCYLYREYDRNNFLHDSSNADYLTLINKLSTAQSETILQMELKNRRLFLDVPGLRRKLPEDMTVSIIYSLIMVIKQKDILPDHLNVFEFLVEHLVGEIYE